MPLLDDIKNKHDFLLAILIQNCLHAKNSARVSAVKQGAYVEFKDDKTVRDYLSKHLRVKVQQKLAAMLQDQNKVNRTRSAHETAELILKAPDVYYAAAILVKNPMIYGAGDFLRVMKILEVKKSKEFKDIARKLVLIKTGHLYKKGI